MSYRRINSLLTGVVLSLGVLACNAVLPGSQPASAPTLSVVTLSSPSEALPQTEADVPRISVENAKAAFDSGEAVFVDVRSASEYDARHITGAMEIALADIESNPTGLSIDKDQWIITYCT